MPSLGYSAANDDVGVVAFFVVVVVGVVVDDIMLSVFGILA